MTKDEISTSFKSAPILILHTIWKSKYFWKKNPSHIYSPPTTIKSKNVLSCISAEESIKICYATSPSNIYFYRSAAWLNLRCYRIRRRNFHSIFKLLLPRLRLLAIKLQVSVWKLNPKKFWAALVYSNSFQLILKFTSQIVSFKLQLSTHITISNNNLYISLVFSHKNKKKAKRVTCKKIEVAQLATGCFSLY